MRRCSSEPTIRFPRPAPRSVATSAFTTPGALTRALTGRRQTMLTSLACRTSRQPEPGRRSTYQNRNAVQTNRATAKITERGIEDVSNEMGAFMVARAESHDAAARLFEKHPHFTIFPGESVEIMRFCRYQAPDRR